MKNHGNSRQYAHRYGAGKGWVDRYKSPEYLENAEKLFGKRCVKHASEQLPCKRCEELERERTEEYRGADSE